ncbi:hypothetical protein H2198_010774 [Neophaeococcomyces mojaviensis]|uniref:Uncharacterized protein n=1 Tax=Neophaeococcomyces mojaviensis TaxID=3383035 RepID=A0ACC2ZQQ3_9EURO|nr:hypothetical protein H2198_010774 [Knufia sp. JES_112]
MDVLKATISIALLSQAVAAAQGINFGPSIAEITPEWNNVFPVDNFNREVTTPFWEPTLMNDTTTTEISQQLNAVSNASFIVYDKEMYRLLNVSDHNASKTVEVIFKFPDKPSYAQRQIHDGTVYVPEMNAVFFTDLYSPKPGYGMRAIPFVWRINLSNNSSPNFEKVYPDPPFTIANGAYYHNGAVYWVQEGNYTTPGGVVRMDPVTLKTQVVKNNFYTHRFNSPNDIVVSNSGAAFFTDGYYGHDNFNDSLNPQLVNGVYRWDMNTGNIKMVAGAADGGFFNPNGLSFNADQSKLFVTNRGNNSADANGARTIFSYDVTATGIARREVFAYTDAGFPDGIKTDRDGRVYGAVTGGVDVFNKDGTLIGRIKVNEDDVAVNMAWVGNWLYIVGRDYVYRVQLATTEK